MGRMFKDFPELENWLVAGVALLVTIAFWIRWNPEDLPQKGKRLQPDVADGWRLNQLDSRRARRFEFEGHSYIHFFREGFSRSGFAVVHDPDCECTRENRKGSEQ